MNCNTIMGDIVLLVLLSSGLGDAGAVQTLKDVGSGRKETLLKLSINAKDARGLLPSIGSAVSVHCTEVSMIVIIKAGLLNNGGHVSLGQAIHSEEGPCQAVAVSDLEYVIEAGLHDCDSELTITGDIVVYSNTLKISPAASYHGITKVTNTVVPISCHYKRTHFVSINVAELPAFEPTSGNAMIENSGFSIKLMTDDWRGERSSNVFYLGDIMHLEFSYSDPGLVPRRVFIDSCVASLEPNASSVPRYYFIGNYGCLTDAKEEGSNAKYQFKTRGDVLQLSLDAILFHQDKRNTLFITCNLKATSGLQRSSTVSKACNYSNFRWTNVDGNDYVCRCCESFCYKGSSQLIYQPVHRIPEDTNVCGVATLGPMLIFARK